MDNNSSEEIDESSGDDIENKDSLIRNQRHEETKQPYGRKFYELNEDEKVIESKGNNAKEKEDKNEQDNDSHYDKNTSSISGNERIDANADDLKEEEEEEKEDEEDNPENKAQTYDENYSKDLIIRHWLQKIFLQTIYGSMIEGFTGFLAWSSSMINVIITFYDSGYLWFDYVDLFL